MGQTLSPDTALISVIMPCYNAAGFLEEAVGSVMGQSYPAVELIIVDDGSTDSSVEMLKQLLETYPGRIHLLYQNREGPYVARNLGLGQAQGEFVAFLDADDYWAPDCLEKLHSALTQSNAVLAYCGWQNVGLPGKRGEPYVPPDYELEEDKAARFLRAASPWPIHAALTRRDALESVGGFDTNWFTCMDYDLWLRIGVANHIVRVPEVLAFYRHHTSGQITSKQWIQAENTWLVKKKFVQDRPDLVAHLGQERLKELIDGALIQRGYNAYWQRDLVSAHRIFRKVLSNGGWKLPDLRYLIPALLPEFLYRKIISAVDRRPS